MAYSWSGGTPTASAANSTTGLYFTGIGNGYQLSVPAQSSQSVVKLYLGLWTARGRLEAKLSDGSVPSYVAYLDNSAGSVDRVVTLSFSAASSGVNLIIGYTVENNYGNIWGNITLQAATLVEERRHPQWQLPPLLRWRNLYDLCGCDPGNPNSRRFHSLYHGWHRSNKQLHPLFCSYYAHSECYASGQGLPFRLQ